MRRSILLLLAPGAAFVFFLVTPDERLFRSVFRNGRIAFLEI
jgi:hypothetical protein